MLDSKACRLLNADHRLKAERVALKDDEAKLAQALLQAGSQLLESRGWSDAEKVLHEYSELKASEAANAGMRLVANMLQGAAYVGQEKLVEAESLLSRTFAELLERVNQKRPPEARTVLKALNIVVRVYSDAGRDEESRHWNSNRNDYFARVNSLPSQ